MCPLRVNIVMEIIFLPMIILWFCKTMQASYIMSVFVKEIINPGQKLSDGESHCDTLSRCDYNFKICLDIPNGILESHDHCRVKDIFEVEFRKAAEKHIDQPWKGNVSMKVTVYDDDTFADDLVDKVSGIIQLSAYPTREAARNKQFTLNGTRTSLILKIGVYCKEKWVGQDCNCYKEHTKYTCTDRGEKECRPSWYGPECSVRCWQKSGLFDNYNCSKNGTKLCHENYYGEDCSTLCKPQNDNKAGYTCAKDGSKTCLMNWCSQYCNVSCPESSPIGTKFIATTRGIVESNTQSVPRTTRRAPTGNAKKLTTTKHTGRGHTTRTTKYPMPSHQNTVKPNEKGKSDEPETNENERSKPGNQNLVIGGVGGVLLLLVAIGLSVFCYKRKQKKGENGRNETISMQGLANSRENNTGGVIYDEINHDENLYEDAVAVAEQLYEDPNEANAADTYAVPDKKRGRSREADRNNVSDSVLIMENECYGSASEAGQTRPQNVRAAVNASDDVLIMDNELYGTASEVQDTEPKKAMGARDSSDDVLIVDNELYG